MERHNISPIFDENSKILILGSFPSVKSREGKFFYNHPQNRFWKVISKICKYSEPKTVQDKITMLLENNIAVWDVIQSCDIIGSSDSSIKNVIPNDISKILDVANIRNIYTNGTTAHKMYKKYLMGVTNFQDILLPSTSPANAKYRLDDLIEQWKIIVN